MDINELLARRDELQGDRADFLSTGNSIEREQAWNEMHGAELREILEALDAAGETP